MRTARRGTAAFTLIELLVVVSIVVVQEAARRTVCGSNLRQWGMAMLAYCQDNDGIAVGPEKYNRVRGMTALLRRTPASASTN